MANRGDGKESESGGKFGISCLVMGAGLAVGGICLIGVVAAVAIPSFINYTKRAKASEAGSNLRAMYTGAAAYYVDEHVTSDGSVLEHCTVDAATTPVAPGAHKTSLAGRWPESFVALGLTPPDPLYYQYEIVGGPSRCGVAPNEAVYSFRAHGDLDADGVLSTYEMSVGSNEENELYRSPGIHTVNELE